MYLMLKLNGKQINFLMFDTAESLDNNMYRAFNGIVHQVCFDFLL